MNLVSHLVCYTLRLVLGEAADHALKGLAGRLGDASQALPRALARANDRAWQALGMALAGDGFLDQLKTLLVARDTKALREQIRRFLEVSAFSFEGRPAEF